MALGNDEKAYTLFGKLPEGWIVTLRIDKQGIANARVKERREPVAGLEDLAKWCLLGNAPRPGGLALPATGISLEMRGEDGTWDCEWTYEGFAGDPSSVVFGAVETTSYELDCTLTTAPIETHPNFLEIVDHYGSKKQFDKTGQFLGFVKTLAQSKADGSGDVQNPAYGIEDYYVSTLCWRVNSCARSLPADFHKNLGRIDVPRIGDGPQPPQLEGRANWLKSVARAPWRGNIYQTQEEWIASGPNGWDSEVYRRR